MTTQPTKKLINDVDRCVDEAIEGLVAITPGITKLAGHRIVVRDDLDDVKKSGKVTLLSGGGSGHEPSHAGYVGRGMLSGAIAGSVFASPPTSSILAAIRAVGRDNPAGTLLIVKNYTGDCINFGIAMERARAEGILVEMVVVKDDCALAGQDLDDRRGLAGTVFIHKLAGGMAESGLSLHQIKQAVESACSSMGTVGVCLYPCSVPGAGPSFSLGPQEIGLGLGIHGEAGIKQLQLSSATDVVATMLDQMRDSTNNCRLDLKSGDEVALMINNLGGTSNLEMAIVARSVLQYLSDAGVKRVYCGCFMTSLEMVGISLTILILDQSGQRASYLDQATSAPAWPSVSHRHGKISLGKELPVLEQASSGSTPVTRKGEKLSNESCKRIKTVLSSVCYRLMESEKLLNDLDTSSGDGDCGSTLRRGAEAMKTWIESEELLYFSDVAGHMSLIAEEAMGGSSGAFYGLFLLAAQQALGDEPGFGDWVEALRQGMDRIMKYGKAEVGDRTMLDPLDAAYRILKEGHTNNSDSMKTLEDAVNAAEQSAEATSMMAARAGRARYVNPDQLGRPDPGAMAVAIWLRAAHNALRAL
ncbi:triokinase/FMN cyclase-like [Strongylocentrotus purpuratus]|uniref:Triokinase/FMN cyclase n=1 Tax=Strongylocentrotus purpuratus TaxID=7668 RepID=A0A7M7PUG2_STRPU|nr:triokinase/FMN cyclase-like [Strongylocentrotus purpuratus]